MNIEHLDGRVLVVNCKAGEIIKPNDVKIVKGEGFPEHRHIFNKGDLYIVYESNTIGRIRALVLQPFSFLLPLFHSQL